MNEEITVTNKKPEGIGKINFINTLGILAKRTLHTAFVWNDHIAIVH